MAMVSLRPAWILLVAACLFLQPPVAVVGSDLPPFGLDTVLVWGIDNEGKAVTFVVRVAQFTPGRYFEWEDGTTQGTVYLPADAVDRAKNYVNSRLFEGGTDRTGKNMTTLWLSRKIFSDLKEKQTLKLVIDSVPGWMKIVGTDSLPVEVNRETQVLPVLKVMDSRGQERWFLDDAGNPLLVRHIFRSFDQKLRSITTDRKNTLRWIKGKKLRVPR